DGFIADINVLVDGAIIDTQSVTQDADGTNLDWTTFTVNFVATGTTTTIAFEETDDVAPDDYGAILDNVGLFLVGLDPADLDMDGDVADADFGIAFAAFTGPNNGPSNNPAADLDGDGDVDDADFGIAFAAFTGPGGAASVPEPTGVALLGMGLLTRARRRRAS
ncbi:MAG: PEP-CTERM sorting domain-containing protein, partial [Pirellulales bacterium]|nr:PEP-CTERM sorting domain-containing protein [Pirellulales bacterium]